MTLDQLIKLAVAASIPLLVAGMGMRVTFAEATSFFHHVLRPPRSLVRAVLAMNFVVPIMAAAVALAFDLKPPVKVAIVAMSISPVPPILPGKQLKFGGRASYVYGLLVAVSLAAILFVPLSVQVLGWMLHREFHMGFGAIIMVVGRTILVPLCIGLAIGGLAPAAAARIGPWMVRLGNLLLIAALLPLIIALSKGMWLLVGNGTIVAITVVVGIAIAAGHWIGGPDEYDRTALGIVSAMRHPGVALTIGVANFPDDKLVPAGILLFTLVAAITTTLYGKLRLRRRPTPAGSSLPAPAHN